MASEKDLELLDDYLSNRLGVEDKAAFEQKIQADPDLMKELEFQQDLVESIKQVRVAELKTILNNIPLSSIPTGQTSLITKIGSVIIIGGLVVTGLYYYFSNDSEPVPQTPLDTEVIDESKTEEPPTADETPITESAKEEPLNTAENTEKESVTSKPAPAKKPNLNVYDPTKEKDQPELDPQEQIDIISHAFVTSSIEVETNSESKDYSFHYMFKNKRLVLFGIQEDDLYEILEFIYDEKRTVFLFYKSNYYWLDLNKEAPTKLSPISDRSLLKKLKEYRGSK
jgi:hypothetical protein